MFLWNIYYGYITIADVIYKIGEPYQLTEIGILTIECTMEDYSLSEISRLIEQNKGKVISSFVQINPNSKNIYVDIIINQKNLTRIIKSLKRFKWNVIETYDTSLFENLSSMVSNSTDSLEKNFPINKKRKPSGESEYTEYPRKKI